VEKIKNAAFRRRLHYSGFRLQCQQNIGAHAFDSKAATLFPRVPANKKTGG